MEKTKKSLKELAEENDIKKSVLKKVVKALAESESLAKEDKLSINTNIKIYNYE